MIGFQISSIDQTQGGFVCNTRLTGVEYIQLGPNAIQSTIPSVIYIILMKLIERSRECYVEPGLRVLVS